jgi:excisionase family DNA binding protein
MGELAWHQRSGHHTAMPRMDSTPQDSAYLSPEDFARRSGLSVSTVRRYLADGRLPKFQPGGKRCRVLIPSSALAGHLDATSNVTLKREAPDRRQEETRPPGPKPKWLRRI